MSAGQADIVKAVNTLWNSSGLDDLFTVHWSASEITKFEALNDSEASPGQAWPYCVVEMPVPEIVTRMSGGEPGENWHTRDVPCTFHVYATEISGDARTAKQIAAYFAEEIMKVFGGHPTVPSTPMNLDVGNVLLSQYQSDYCVRVGDEEWQWLINYIFRIDVPVMA